MNNLKEQLRALREIKPDQEFSNRSKLAIFGTPQETSPSLTWRQFILGTIEYGGALALAAILFIVIAGNTPLGKILAPFDTGSLNSANLQAEAEAIDIQIKLLDVDNYLEESITATSLRTTTLSTSSKSTLTKTSQKNLENETTTIAITEISEDQESSTLIFPDEALRLLAQ